MTPVLAVRFRHVCSYCGRVTQQGDPGAPVSHGICSSDACRAKFLGRPIPPRAAAPDVVAPSQE